MDAERASSFEAHIVVTIEDIKRWRAEGADPREKLKLKALNAHLSLLSVLEGEGLL